MSKVDFLTLDNIRKSLREYLEPAKERLMQFHEEVMRHIDDMDREVKEFIASGNLPTDVWQYIQGKGDQVKMSDVLDRVHSSIYPTQNLLDSLQLNHFDVITLISSDAKVLFDTAELSVENHNIFDRVVFTNADRTRESKYAMLDCMGLFQGIKSRCARAKMFVTWAAKQIESLNRIDSMIRLKQKIGEHSFYESLMANSTITL